MDALRINKEINSWSRCQLEKLTIPQPVKKFPSIFMETGNQIPYTQMSTSFTCPPTGEFSPTNPTSFKFHLILSYHLRPGLQSVFFPLGFTTKILYIFLFSPNRSLNVIYTCCYFLSHFSFIYLAS